MKSASTLASGTQVHRVPTGRRALAKARYTIERPFTEELPMACALPGRSWLQKQRPQRLHRAPEAASCPQTRRSLMLAARSRERQRASRPFLESGTPRAPLLRRRRQRQDAGRRLVVLFRRDQVRMPSLVICSVELVLNSWVRSLDLSPHGHQVLLVPCGILLARVPDTTVLHRAIVGVAAEVPLRSAAVPRPSRPQRAPTSVSWQALR
mmetsp:Transcript_59033/g.157875  ORF Transcript_59033/g.157875 Transcript_59033/m.157875 type:complete len:209 (+) Transcript_59033:318-944(+)